MSAFIGGPQNVLLVVLLVPFPSHKYGIPSKRTLLVIGKYGIEGIPCWHWYWLYGIPFSGQIWDTLLGIGLTGKAKPPLQGPQKGHPCLAQLDALQEFAWRGVFLFSRCKVCNHSRWTNSKLLVCWFALVCCALLYMVPYLLCLFVHTLLVSYIVS